MKHYFPARVIGKLLALAIGSVLLMLLTFGATTEYYARRALDQANFSQITYQYIGTSWNLRSLKSSDRNPTNFHWIPFFPNLETVELTASGDNSNSFSDLRPFAEIPKLKELRLTGVGIKALMGFPYCPNLERVTFTESYIGTVPTNDDYIRLRMALPKIKQFEVLQDSSSDSRITYDPVTKMYRYIPPRD